MTRWKKLTEKYVENLEKKVKYTYIDEPEILSENDELEELANNIFGDNNIIMEDE